MFEGGGGLGGGGSVCVPDQQQGPRSWPSVLPDPGAQVPAWNGL